jgi:hypothetical protein
VVSRKEKKNLSKTTVRETERAPFRKFLGSSFSLNAIFAIRIIQRLHRTLGGNSRAVEKSRGELRTRKLRCKSFGRCSSTVVRIRRSSTEQYHDSFSPHDATILKADHCSSRLLHFTIFHLPLALTPHPSPLGARTHLNYGQSRWIYQ